MYHKLFQIATLLCAVCFNARGQNTDLDRYESFSHTSAKGTLPYRIMWPKDFSEDQKYPLVLFLHGAGECGNDNKKQLTHGGTLFATTKNRTNFPAVVLFPQCPQGDFWTNALVDKSRAPNERLIFTSGEAPTKPMLLLLELLDQFKDKPYINKDRLHALGLSMGAMGTFELVSRRPEMFASAIAICGGGNTDDVLKYALNTPFWIIHGSKDKVVSPKYSLAMVKSLLEAGASPKFSLYDDAGHNSWDTAFAEPDFLKWLFLYSLNKAP